MKRILEVLFVLALAFTMVSGCACFKDDKKCTELCAAAMDKAQATEQQCSANLRTGEAAAQKAEAAAQKAEAAARRAEAAADKAESIFMKHMKK